VTLREEHRLGVFEKRVLRRISDEVTGGWRRMHNDELHNFYSLSNIIRMIKTRRMEWAGYLARMGIKRNALRILVGKPEVKRPLGIPRRNWEDNIRKDLGETDWIYLTQDRGQWRVLVNTVRNLRVLYNITKFLSSCTTGDFSRWAQLRGVR
jgi:hypothetical protein